MEFIDELKTLKDQVRFAKKFKVEEDFENIVIAGMGGSGIAGKIFQEIYTKRPVLTVDDYHIPEFVNDKTLFIATSYSGNTEETIAATDKAIQKGAKIMIITTGGRLSGYNEEKISVPPGLQPRSSLGYMLMPLINTFMPQSEAVIGSTSKMLEEMDRNNEDIRKTAELVWEGNKIPVIYGQSPFKSISYRWKTQFNENSKILAYSSSFPELNHNDTVPLKNTYRKDEFIFLTFDTQSDPRISKRIEVTSNITETSFLKIRPRGNTTFENLFYLIHYGDYLSYHLSLMRGLDPADVSVIEELKQRLSENGKHEA